MMHMPLLDQGGRWTGQWSERAVEPYVAPTLAQLRATSRYWVISDVQLKRDLKGRTLADVYRDNKVGRGWGCELAKLGPYEPKCMLNNKVRGGLFGTTQAKTIEDEYLAWCKERGHTPHPASLDPDHPQNVHRLKAPKRELV